MFKKASVSERGLPFMTSALRGEGGVPSKADMVSNLSKGGCVNLRTGGGKGQKIRKFYGRHIWKPPYRNLVPAA